MAKIRSNDTKPELIVRRYLYHRGYRYRKNVKGLPGTPDIVLRKYGVVIFIHGCFWHGHEVDKIIPHTNTEFWYKKIETNKKRDERNKEALKKLGWNVITIWECQLSPLYKNRHCLKWNTISIVPIWKESRTESPKTMKRKKNQPISPQRILRNIQL